MLKSVVYPHFSISIYSKISSIGTPSELISSSPKSLKSVGPSSIKLPFSKIALLLIPCLYLNIVLL